MLGLALVRVLVHVLVESVHVFSTWCVFFFAFYLFSLLFLPEQFCIRCWTFDNARLC